VKKSSVLTNRSETNEKFFADLSKGFPSFPDLISVGIKTRAVGINDSIRTRPILIISLSHYYHTI